MSTNRPVRRTPVGGAVAARSELAMATACALLGASVASAADVRLNAPACATPGSIIEVELVVDPEGASGVGLQALLRFDASVLRMISFEAGDAPYVVSIWSSHDPTDASVDVAVGFDPTQGQSQSGVAVAKRMRFEVLPTAATCSTAGLVGFREDPPFKTMLTTMGGMPVDPDLVQLGALTVSPPPTLADAADITIAPSPKMDCVVPALAAPPASAACGPAPTVTWMRSDGATTLTAPMCRLNSPISVTWTATDSCGRAVSTVQQITVPGLAGDLNSDGMVDAYDLAVVLGAWGSASGVGDLNGDLTVDGTDLSVLLGRWTDSVP